MEPFNIACHECDLIQRVEAVPIGRAARCRRCGCVLIRRKPDSLQRPLAFTLAALFFFIMANINPIMVLNIEGQVQAATLIAGTRTLYQEGMWLLALVVLVTSIVAPMAQISGMLYVLLPLSFNLRPPIGVKVFRWIRQVQPWGMMEVFLLGILISVVKLAKMAEIIPGMALYSIGALIFVLAASTASLDPHQIWERVGVNK